MKTKQEYNKEEFGVRQDLDKRKVSGKYVWQVRKKWCQT